MEKVLNNTTIILIIPLWCFVFHWGDCLIMTIVIVISVIDWCPVQLIREPLCGGKGCTVFISTSLTWEYLKYQFHQWLKWNILHIKRGNFCSKLHVSNKYSYKYYYLQWNVTLLIIFAFELFRRRLFKSMFEQNEWILIPTLFFTDR